MHVVKSGQGQGRKSFDVAFDLLASGPASMITLMHYRVGNVIPAHAHPNEQAGYLLSGRVKVTAGDVVSELTAGDSYVIPADIEHSIEILEDAEELQVFTPLRPEFLNQ
mgnify:CR=1 FL=1